MVFPEKKREVCIEKPLKDTTPNVAKLAGFSELYQTQKSIFNSTEEGDSAKLLKFEDDPTVIILGTGSMMPATFRNVSAISLTVNHNFNILLDCGEGTFAQIIEAQGISGIDQYLEDLRVIYITHIHPDHNLGLFKVLSERKALESRLGRKFEVGLVLQQACVCGDAEEHHLHSDSVPLISRRPRLLPAVLAGPHRP